MPELPSPDAPLAVWKRYVADRLEAEGRVRGLDDGGIEELANLFQDVHSDVVCELDDLEPAHPGDRARIEQLFEQRIGSFEDLCRELERDPRDHSADEERLAEPPTRRSRVSSLGDVLGDLKTAGRSLWRAPALTSAAVLVLATGIGSITAIFSILDSVVLEPLPYQQPERLGIVTVDAFGGTGFPIVTDSNLIDFSESATTLESVESFALMKLLLEADERTHLVTVTSATPGLLRLLGVRVAHGRDFRESGDAPESGPGNVILSHRLWSNLFDADPDLVGTTVRVSDQEVQVVGVLPADFKLLVRPGVREESDLLIARPRPTERGILFGRRALVRVADSASFDSATTELEALAIRGREIDRAQGLHQEGEASYNVVPLHESLVGEARPALLGVLVAGALVLILVCASVAHLLLLRGLHRQADWALRTALGASRARLLRHGLAESLVLAVLGGGLGLGVTWLILPLAVHLPGIELPRLDQLAISHRALLFCLVATTLAALASGLAPALSTTRAASRWLHERTGSSSPESSRTSSLLVGGQIAFAVVLLVTAGALVESLGRLHDVPLGFDSEHLIAFDFSLNQELARDPAARLRFNREFLDWLRARPDIEAASLTNVLPFVGGRNLASYSTNETTEASFGELTASFHRILPGYFETLGIPLIEGRDFDRQDTDQGAYTAIVSSSLARSGWPDESAVGNQLLIEFAADNGTERRPAEIVGVVGDIRETDLSSSPLPQVYLPYWPTTWAQDFVVRSRADPDDLARAFDDELRSLGPGLVLDDHQPLANAVRATTAKLRLALVLISTFAAAALLISCLSLYGALASTVRRRTADIGVRMVLGASGSSVLGNVIGRGLRIVAIGAGLGVISALAVARSFQSQFEGVELGSLSILAWASLLVTAAALLACTVPAYRAISIAPSEALRSE